MADRSVVYRLRAEVGQFSAQMAQAGASTKKFGDDLVGLDAKGEKMRRGLDELAGTSGRIGLVLGGAFAASVVKAANFEQAMSYVQAATHETAQNMEELRQAALDAGAQTAFSATESAAAIEELAKAGVSTEAILGGGLSGALDLAAAGGLDVAKAAEAAASAMTQFKLSGDDVPHIADLLAAGAGKAQGSVEDMSMALNQSGLVASQTGLSIEETTGALSAFASAGLTGSDAGTSFKTMLQALTPTSKEAAKLMDQLGISAYDSQGNFVGLTEFAESLRAGLADLSVEQQNAALKTIFGSDAVRAAAVIYEQGGKGLQEWIDKTNDSGYAAETAAIRMDNLKGDLEQLGGAFETLLIGGGDGQTGFLREWTQGATGLVDGLNALPGPVKGASASLIGLAAVGAGAFWFTSKAVSTVASTREALAALEFQAGATKASLSTMGKGAGVFAVVAASIPSLLGDLDSWNRRRTAMDSTSKTFEEFAKSIESSNVGKYAQDFGIDVQKLSEDLYENGASGEYATQVMSELEGRFDGAGDKIQAIGGDVLPFYKDAANKAYDASHDLGDIIKNNGDLMGAAADDARSAAVETANLAGIQISQADAAGRSAAETEEMAKALKDAQDGASETARSFLTLGESLNNPKVSLGDWIGEMEKQARALREFTANSKKAAKEGLDDGLIASLQEAGVEGALRLEQLANASDAEIRRANKAFRSGQNASDAYADAVEVLARRLLGLPPVEKVDVKVNTANAKAALRSFQAQIDALRGKNITVSTTFKNFYTNVKGPKGNRGGVTDPWRGPLENPADGGTIPRPGGRLIRSASGSTVPDDGGGYRDYLPYLLAPGEEVISNRFGQADRHRPLLKAINAGRLADGGTSGGNPTWVSTMGGSWGDAFELPKTLKGLNKALKRSKASLEDETDARDELASKMSSLQDAVAGKLTSDLFGETEAWSAGGSFEDVMAILAGDISTGTQMQKDIAALQKKGLNGGALDALLAQGDAATIGRFAGLTPAQLAQYEKQYERRDNLATATGKSASSAAYGAPFKVLDSSVRRLEGKVGAIEKAIDRNGKKDRDSRKRGKGNAARNRKKG
ncbi:phage tail tape measure protein [Pimelobacter simplex]|uniref:phage tail tape measure protein n=1 Tax=Nocardioides simplex TaxID=2045 RepID=UPI00367104F3